MALMTAVDALMGNAAATQDVITNLTSITEVASVAEKLRAGLKDKKKAPAAVAACESLLTAMAAVSPSENQLVSVALHGLTLEIFDDLMALSHEAKFGKIITKTLKTVLQNAADNERKGALRAYLPKVLTSIESPFQNKWKIKVVALDLLNEPLMEACAKSIAKQLEANFLVRIVRCLCLCCKEVRADIKDLAIKLLKQVGKLVRCAEIRQIVEPSILPCLCNFGNNKLATETLYLIANTTFLSYVDAASFALIFPIVERAMKERQQESRKNGIMITGACVTLIEDASILTKYLDTLVPLLQELALDPSFEIQRESAKAFGALAKNMPQILDEQILPWVLEKLQSNNGDIHTAEVERLGAAHSLAEILEQVPTLMPKVLRSVILPRCFAGVKEMKNNFTEEELNGLPKVEEKTSDAGGLLAAKRAGAFMLFEYIAKTSNFEKYVDTCFSWVLKGLNDRSKPVREKAMLAGKQIVHEFGGTKTQALIKPLADAVMSFEGSGKEEDSPRNQVLSLFRFLVEKVSEMKKYGQDLMTMDCCPMDTRLTVACLLQMSRCDEDPGVRRQSNKLWQEGVQSSAKTKKETQKNLLASLKYIAERATNAAGEANSAITLNSVSRTLESMKEAKECDYANVEALIADANVNAAKDNVFRNYNWDDVLALGCGNMDVAFGKQVKVNVLGGKKAVEADKEAEKSEEASSEVLWTDLEARANVELEKSELKSNLYLSEIVIASALESRNPQEAAEVVGQEFVSSDDVDVSALLNAIFGGFVSKEVVIERPEEIICRVEKLMLMYGGGHMLLKDTAFELRKGKRYGVVGRNGCGKTTLMNLLAKGNKAIAQLPPTMTSIHVKPEVLDNFMTTKCKAFMQMENPESSNEELEATLIKVDFPENLWNSTIGELSGGWRMRLLIAGAMMKKADVLLLDEPTNHLDINAVKWLCDYLNSLSESAIMVISHDPFFLNSVCTNIINYNSGKLVYYEGNFTAFTDRMGINSADAEQLLAGNVGVGDNGIEREEEKKDEKKENDADESSLSLKLDEASTAAPSPADTPRSSTCGTETTDSAPQTPRESEAGDSSPTESLKKDEDFQALPETAKGTPDKKAKIVFPIPGKVKGVNSLAKPVLEIDNLTWAYNEEKGDVLQGVSSKVTMNSRIHIKGVNGAGKSTFINLICGEVHPNSSAMPQKGTVTRHRNCRLAYMAQQHMHHMMPFMNSSPYIYLQKRFANGYDGALQDRLTQPQNEEEAQLRAELAKKHGKYGNAIDSLVGRQLRGKELYYEVKWQNLTDSKQNTWENLAKLRLLGCETFALAYDDRAAAAEAGLDQRPLSQREIVKHLEQFGITEELALNRTIGMFSAGQKSKVSMAAAFWMKPHIIALDEPTNYIDMETVESLIVALQRFKGGVICISHCKEFAERVCNETWFLEGGGMAITKKGKEEKAKK